MPCARTTPVHASSALLRPALPAPFALVVLVVAGLTACDTAPKTQSDRAALEADARATIERFSELRPDVAERYFDNAIGWAVFPKVGKGAAVVGGAYGRGVLYQDGALIGYCDITQASIGAQLGGQAYSEIIFFEATPPLKRFKNNSLELSAQASAVAAHADAASSAAYDQGVAVFTMDSQGAMAEASVGGQTFSYQKKY
ncbi:MAG: hypothetical protein GVY28_09535 [Alphaproteobacteria bacterium]|nr:hypothetical protein [Alphaproteobacteria bacterium]